MAERVILHIGPRKTATTYLQRVMQSLVRSKTIPGKTYPIRTRGRLDHNQVPGLIDLARDAGEIALQSDAWTQQDGTDAAALVRAVKAAPADVLLSGEAMSVLRREGARTVVEAFGPTPVDVVITLRGLDRVLPSSWQQHIRNGNIVLYEEYLTLRAEERDSQTYDAGVRRAFWRAYRYGDLMRCWQGVARSVSVVTVPSSGKDPAIAWRRFRAAVGLAFLPEDPPVIKDDTANVSFTGAETFALRNLNCAMREAGQGRREVRAMHRSLRRAGWTQRAHRGNRLGLPEDLQDTVRAWMTADLEDLRTCDVAVCGDLNDLAPTGGVDPGLPSPDEVAQATEAAQRLLQHPGSGPQLAAI